MIVLGPEKYEAKSHWSTFELGRPTPQLTHPPPGNLNQPLPYDRPRVISARLIRWQALPAQQERSWEKSVADPHWLAPSLPQPVTIVTTEEWISAPTTQPHSHLDVHLPPSSLIRSFPLGSMSHEIEAI